MTVFNFIVLVMFVPTVMLICWMIWHEEDLIEFEQKVRRKIRGFIDGTTKKLDRS